MEKSLVVVFGATGFIGRHVVQKLVSRGYRVRAAVRRPEQALFLKSMGDVGQVSLIQANVCCERDVVEATAGAGAVVNSVGILAERGNQNFNNLHVFGTQLMIKAAVNAKVRHFVQISAIGADVTSPSTYSRSKALGEAAVKHFPGAVSILRPSLVFGVQDKFFNRFAAMSRFSPIMTIINGSVRFQPVYVGDVAEATARVLVKAPKTKNVIELGGPVIYSFRELIELILQQAGRRRFVASIPGQMAMPMAFLLGLLPDPPLTIDQVRLLRRDTITSPTSQGLSDLDIVPTPLEVILPQYLLH
ncbi:MAG: complex I NDUFA9 subunit family protein [Rhodospirillaceae bacterium]|nr:complex I NDUFA9 subunit family protein [Rhodospirillaceae bacterium]